MKTQKTFVLLSFLLLFSLNSNFIFSQEYSDHPEFGRYGNSSISHQERSNLNEYTLALGPVINESVTETMKVEGKVMMTLYNGPEDASTFEIFQAYRELLLSKGFEILFSCSKGECGDKFLGAYYDLAAFAYDYGYNSSAPITQGNKDVSYVIVGKKPAGEKTVYVSLIVTQGWYKFPNYKLDIVETVNAKSKIISVRTEGEKSPEDQRQSGRSPEYQKPATEQKVSKIDEDDGKFRFGFHLSSDTYFGLLFRAKNFELVLKASADLFDGFPGGMKPDDFLMAGVHTSYLFRPWEKIDIGTGIDLRQGIPLSGDTKYTQYIDAGPMISFNYRPNRHFVISGLFYPIWLSTRETDQDDSFSLMVKIPRAAISVGFLF